MLDVLIVDDDPFSLRLLQKMVAQEGYRIFTARNGKEALRIVCDSAPSIVITNWAMPEMDGIQLAKALRNHDGIGFTYVVMITGQSDVARLVEAFDAGVDDYLAKPVNRTELMARLKAGARVINLEQSVAKRSLEIMRLNAEMAVANEKLGVANQRLAMMATTDELTGLLNRREAIVRLDQAWDAQSRYATPFSLVVMDIDHFKCINDTHGHAAGDLVLKTVSAALRKTVRTSDILCRIGGEEFLVICTNVGREGAFVCAEHLRKCVEELEVKFKGAQIRVTVSAGVAERDEAQNSPDDLLITADEALYASKKNGRNRVTMAGVKIQPTLEISPTIGA